jgi:hypothetical protein
MAQTTWEAEIERTVVGGQSWQIVHEITHLQDKQARMDWKCDSSDRAPALQAWSSEFKLHAHQRKKKERHSKD